MINQVIGRWKSALAREDADSLQQVFQDVHQAKAFLAALTDASVEFPRSLAVCLQFLRGTALSVRQQIITLLRLGEALRETAAGTATGADAERLQQLQQRVENLLLHLAGGGEDQQAASPPAVNPAGELSEGAFTYCRAQLNEDFCVKKVDRALLQRFHCSESQVIGRPFSSLFSSSSHSLIAYARRKLTSGSQMSVELELAARTATEEHFQARVRLERSNGFSGGSPVSAEIRDTSYQEETSGILNLIMLALESINEGIVIIEPRPRGKILFVNLAMETITGFQRQELLGKNWHMLLGGYLEKHLEEQIISNCQQDGWRGELTYQTAQGQARSVYLDALPVRDSRGQMLAVVGIQRDIGKEKHQVRQILTLQNLISQIIDNMQHYIMVTDVEHRIKFWNRSLETDSGIPSREAIEHQLTELLPPLSDLIISDAGFLPADQQHSISFRRPIRLFKAEVRHYQISVIFLEPSNPKSFRLWVIQDVHEEELRKEKITWQNTRLQFLESLSHILNSSLDLSAVLAKFSTEFQRIFPFASLSVLLPVDRDSQHLQVFFSAREPAIAIPRGLIIRREKILPDFQSAPQAVVQYRPAEFPDHPIFDQLRRHGARGAACFPIIFSSELLGILQICPADGQTINRADLEFLAQIIGHLTVAMKNCIQFEQLEKQNLKLSIIHGLFSQIRKNLAVETILQKALKDLAAAFNYSVLALFREEASGIWVRMAQISSTKAEQSALPEQLPPGCPVEDAPELWIDIASDFDVERIIPGIKSAIQPRTAVCLEESSLSLGNLFLFGAGVRYLPDLSYRHHVDLLRTIFKELSLAIDHSFLFSQTLKSEREWQTTFNEVQIALAVIDENARITLANKAFWDIFQPEQPIPAPGIPCRHFFELPEWNENRNSERSPENHRVEWQDARSGKTLVRHFFSLPGKPDGFKGGIVTVQDVTAEREQESHIRYLSRFPEINPNIVMNLSAEGELLYCNAASTRLLESFSAAPTHPEQLIPTGLKEDIRQRSIIPGRPYEYVHTVNDRVFQFVCYMPEDDNNLYLYGMEISDRLELQNRLIQTERIRAMGEMAAGVAHDFNNLLTTILGKTQLLLLRAEDPLLSSELRVVEKAARDGAEIVKRMQASTRRERQETFEPAYLSEIIQDSLLFSAQKLKLDAQVRGKKIQVQTDFDNDLAVYGNPIELKEVFTNLIFNAFDAMPEGGELRLQIVRKDEHTVLTVVEDTGTGMPEKIRQKIFDPFFTTKGERGTGLGLSLVYNIVTAHKGSIRVESEMGKGTRFLVELPLSHQKPVSSVAPDQRVPTAVKNIHLLVVDDEPELLDTIAEVLKLRFTRVDKAASGPEALKMVSESSYDIVLTDLGMPDMSGWEVAREVKNTLPGSKVILVTGWGMQAEDESKHHGYVDKILSKPYDLHHLLNVIEQINRPVKP